MFTLEEVRALGFGIPTDEEIAAKKTEVETAAKAEAVTESERIGQSLRDQLASWEQKHAELTAVPSEAPVEAPSEAPAEEVAQG